MFEMATAWDHGAQPDLGDLLSDVFRSEFEDGGAVAITPEAARFEASGRSSLSLDWWPSDAWPVPVRDACANCGRLLLQFEGARCWTCEGVL